MKAALYGFRKIIVFILAIAALVYGLHVTIVMMREMDSAKALQAAIIAGGFFGAVSTVFGTLMSAFKGAYAAGASPFSPPVVPAADPVLLRDRTTGFTP